MKSYFGALKQIQYIKLVNLLVLVSLILTSCGVPVKEKEELTANLNKGTSLQWNNYLPPIFTHPEPVIAEDSRLAGVTSEADQNASPIVFIENIGQFDENVIFQAEIKGGTLFLSKDAIWITLLDENVNVEDQLSQSFSDTTTVDGEVVGAPTPEPYSPNGKEVLGVNLRISFPNANLDTVEGFTPLDTSINYYIGGKLNEWQKNVPAWQGVRYLDFYPGYNLEITGRSGAWEWSLVKSENPSSEFLPDEQAKIIVIDGADKISLETKTLLASTSIGDIEIPLPEINLKSESNEFKLDNNQLILPLLSPITGLSPLSNLVHGMDDQQITNGSPHTSTPLRARIKLLSPNTDEASPSTSVYYSTYFGGSSTDMSNDIVFDTAGFAYIVGSTAGTTFPVTPGAFNSLTTDTDIFVAKLSPNGDNLEYSARIGGSGLDAGYAIALDASNNAYVTGRTLSSNFPISSGAYDNVNSGSEAFVVKLDSVGDIVYSTFLGSGSTQGLDITANSSGEAYVVGQTNASSFPTTSGAYDRTFNGNWDGFVTQLNSSGTGLVFSTFLGGSYYDCEISGDLQECSIALDSSGSIYIVGPTLSGNFPTTSGAYDTSANGNYDTFFVKMNSTGSSLIYSTYLGGSSNDSCSARCSVTVDADGSVYLLGNTSSSNFPTTSSAYDQSYNGSWDLFITKINPGSGGLLYSTFLGSSGEDIGRGIAVVNSVVLVVGDTSSASFPITSDAFQSTYGGNRDAFVTFLSPDNGGVIYSTFIGGSGIDAGGGFSIVGQALGATGWTSSGDFPITANVYGDTFSGGTSDGFIIKFKAESIINGNSVLSACVGECWQGASYGANGVWGKPINTRTGGQFYQTEDITIPTVAKELNFFRSYSSLATDLYSTTLGYGWTHNLDIRLIFSTDPGGEEGYILLKGNSANQYRFVDHGNGTYSPDYGIQGSLEYGSNQYTLTYPDQSIYTFDDNGRLITWADAQGHEWQYTYDVNGLLEEVSADGGARYLTLGYDGQGRIVSVTDQTERSVTFDYDGNGDLVTMTDVTGAEWNYEYDTAHHLTAVLDPLENALEQTEYDSQGRAVQQRDGNNNITGTLVYNTDGTTTITDSLGNVETHTYDDRLTLVADEGAAGGVTEKTYDNNFRPLTITDADGDTTTLAWSEDGTQLTQVVDAEGGQTDITYDALNNPTSVIDPLGYLTTYAYDGTLLTSTTNALDQETVYTYTTEGYLETVTDPLGNTTSYTYDSFGQRTSMTDALGNTWTYTYDSLGRLVDSTDPLDRVSHNEYDEAGRLLRTTRNYNTNKSQNEDNLWNIITEYEYDLSGKQVLVRDSLGRETHYEYDAAGQLTKTIDPDGNESINAYNSAGQLTQSTDALGHTTTYSYDEAGRLVSTTDALGHTTSTLYNLDGTVASTTDSLGTTSYTYDDLKRVLTVTQPNGAVTTNTYDDNGNLTATTDNLNNTTHYEYDALGRVIKTTDPLGNFTENFYDDAGRLVQTKDARGNATTYAYDDAGKQTSVTDALGNVTSYEYDDLGRRTAVIDAAGNRTEYTYDALDRVVTVTDPLGHTVSTVYDALGQVTQRTDANGNSVSFGYDTLGRTTSQTDAMGNISYFVYNEVGNRVSTTDPRGSVTTITYDELNRPVVTTDPLGRSNTTTYNAAGQVSAVTNANQETTSYTYNSLGQQATVTDAIGNVTQYQYDSLGRMTLMIDANGVATSYEYDDLGRLTAVTENYKAAFSPDDETNVRTEYTYDENGNRLTITDGRGEITTFTYDELNRLLTETDALGNTWSYAYNELGQRMSMTDANGVVTQYEYDDASRLTTIDYANDSDVAFAYDAGGRRTSMSDGVGTTSWVYDNLNRPTEITDPFGSTVINVYDAVGNRTRMVYPGLDVQYTYDAANQMTQVNDWTKNTYYQYDPAGRLKKILRPNGVESTYTYDIAGRLTQLTHATLESELSSFQYAYDNVGNRTQATERLQTSGAGPTIRLTVVENTGALQAGREVHVFDGEIETTYQGVTDANGQILFTLPSGSYRFRVDVDGISYWTDTENHCTIGECRDLILIIPVMVNVVVWDGESELTNQEVYAYQNGEYTGYHGNTSESANYFMRLPAGEYFFKTVYNGIEYWSDEYCLVPGCWGRTISVNKPVTVTVTDNLSMPQSNVPVVVFDGETETQYSTVTDENGQAQLSMPAGDYRFRAEFNGAYYWSGAENHCSMPGCSEATIQVTLPVVVTVLDENETPIEGATVYAYDDETDTGLSGVTDVDGRAQIANLPAGQYRFKTVYNETDYWSDTVNHCTIPECTGASITVSSLSYLSPTHMVVEESLSTRALGVAGNLIPSFKVHALIRDPRPVLDPPNDVTVTVLDTDQMPKEGVTVYAFDGETYTGFSAVTDSNGTALLTLPDGTYRFSTDVNGTIFWSGTENHCEIPNCSSASIEVTIPVTITVVNTNAVAQEGLEVQAFEGENATNYIGTTDAAGEVSFTLPEGSYRFRTNLNGTFFWSDELTCDIPGCTQSEVTVTIPISISVVDTDNAPMEGIEVFAFDGEDYTYYQGITDASGVATLTLPVGSYRFRADRQGIPFWSAAENHCSMPGCEEDTIQITVNKTVAVSVLDENLDPYADVTVYVFDGAVPTGISAQTNANGEAVLVLPDGNYRFAADIRGTLFWSGEENHCEIVGCESVVVSIPGGYNYQETTINYAYDPLYRLTEALYSTGDHYIYSYDAVGNRLYQAATVGELETIYNYYSYDAANRLASVDGVDYTWDDNGNLLSDGTNTYTYDDANRLNGYSNTETTASYDYNGLGDRLTQTVNGTPTHYTLDLASGLTQVLSDGTNYYTYGLGRVSQSHIEVGNYTPEYYLTDALGSVRQLTHESSAILLTQSYDPYGVVTYTAGTSQTEFGFTGEQYGDSTQLIYLRARYYNPTNGRFQSRDTWSGDYNRPLSLNRWMYVEGNPVNAVDPSGHCIVPEEQDQECWTYLRNIENKFPFIDLQTNLSSTDYWTVPELVNISQELELLDRASKIDLNLEFTAGEIQITRIRKVHGNDCGAFSSKIQWWMGNRSIKMYDPAFSNIGCDATLIHEMAHYWDFRDNISGKFKDYVGSYNFLWYPLFYITCKDESPPVYGGRLTAQEDFAESLAEYVLLYTNHPDTELIGIVPGEKRWVFIEALLDTGNISTIP